MSPGPRSPVGDALLRIIHDQPGIHFRALERAAELTSAGQLRHHLDQLSRRSQIVEVQDGGYKRFFAASDHDRNLRPKLARYARPIMRRIAALLLQEDLSRTELRRRLGCADSTLGYYLVRMEKQGELTKRAQHDHWCYALQDPDSVREVLRIQRPVAGAIEENEPEPVRQETAPVYPMFPSS